MISTHMNKGKIDMTGVSKIIFSSRKNLHVGNSTHTHTQTHTHTDTGVRAHMHIHTQ